MNLYASLTDAELSQAESGAYRATLRLFDQAQAVFNEMAALPSTWSKEYKALQRTAASLMAAGREQSELHTELTAEVRTRRGDSPEVPQEDTDRFTASLGNFSA